jgi:hypothetical protein
MMDVITVALVALAAPAWFATGVCIVAFNRSFYPWHRPIEAAGVLPPNGMGPAFVTSRRLSTTPEEEPEAEAYRLTAKVWLKRTICCGGTFISCLGLAVLV